MKRRTFIGAAIASLGLGVFSFLRWMRKPTHGLELAQPKFLSRLCDSQTIQGIGRAYLTLVPEETSNEILWNDLLPGQSPDLLLGRKEISAAEMGIERRIRQDFESEHIVMVQGWILSITEARQCAIYSMVDL